MAERAKPANGKGGPSGAARLPGARIVPLRYARLTAGAAANDNPLPPGRRLRRALILTVIALLALGSVAAYLG